MSWIFYVALAVLMIYMMSKGGGCCGGGHNINDSQDDSHEGHNGGECCDGGSNEQINLKDQDHSSGYIDSIDTSKDPVCGMNVSRKDAISRDINGQNYYFCSDSCAKKFERLQNKIIK